MVTWPSGKAKVCKTFIHQFKSGRHLHKTVMKKMSQSFFFVVASKISDFANQFWTRFYSVVQPFWGGFPNLMPTFPAVFRNLAGEGAIFLRKSRINPAVFRMFSISPWSVFLNCTPFVRQYDILSNKWGDLLCQEENRTNDIRRNSRRWL